MTVKEFFSIKKEPKKELPVSFSVGMLMSLKRVRPVYPVMLSVIAFFALYGSFFTFITACRTRISFELDEKAAAVTIAVSWAVFSLIFGISHSKPKISSRLSLIFGGGLLLFCAVNFSKIIYGIKYFANAFMASLFIRYSQTPMYEIESSFGETPPEKCVTLAMCTLIVICALVVCRTAKTPNLLFFICATFPLPELCLYFGLVPDYKAFIAICAAWCGAAAAEVTRLNMFSDNGSERIFAKTAAQSGTAALAVMLVSFLCAVIYADVTGFERPKNVESFRNNFIVYMKDFSWSKLKEDIADAALPAKDKKMTHDGKLGNVENVEFSGRNMIEVTLPADAKTVYLKGFTGTYYTGSRWEKGEPVPPLDTNITSPEFFSARVLKAYPDFASLTAKDLIIRNTGVSSGVKYYPSNAAGLLETDGIRRRYGVYFPRRNDWQSVVMNYADYITLSGTMATDERKIRAYAYENCMYVPESFTAAEEFFSDYDGLDTEDTLKYIRKELSKRCEYTLDAGKKPFGTDFAQWFLTEKKTGSCTHFASAAVLLCRSRGIPARYCEGFIIKPEDIKKFEEADGFVTVSVPDSRAHAWAEVYIDGFGWLIFESTPGYGNVSYDLKNDPDAWDRAPVSEITEVTTEAPSFTETVTEAFDETTYIDTTFASEAQTEGAGLVPEGTFSAEPVTEANSAAMEGGEGNGTGQQAQAGSGAGDDEGADAGEGMGQGEDIETTVTNGSAADGTTFVSTGEPQTVSSHDKKKIPEAVKYLLIFFGAFGGAAAIAAIRRSAVIASRKKLLESDINRSAERMYRLLLRAAGASNDPEALGERLAPMGIDRECTAVIVNAAERARFGRGIEKKEAERAAEALTAALDALKENRSSARAVIGWIAVTDRFI